MRKMAVAILHDDDLAADAVQDTLVTLWQRRWRLGLIKERQGYCMRTLQHRCIDIIRDQKKVSNIDNEAFGIELPLLSDIDRTEALYHKSRSIGLNVNLLSASTSSSIHEIGIEIGFLTSRIVLLHVCNHLRGLVINGGEDCLLIWRASW